MFLFVVIIYLPKILTESETIPSWDFQNTGPFGDTLNGIMAPFIAMLAAILTFIAFWVQYKANEQQRMDIEFERFQIKFFELLKIHKQNVDYIKSKFKRDYFSDCVEDLRKIYMLSEKFYLDYLNRTHLQKKYDSEKYDENLIRVAYHVFWLGISNEARISIKDMMKNDFEPQFFEQLFNWYQNVAFKFFDYSISKNKNKRKPMFIYKNRYDNMNLITIEKMLFIDRASLLGHYYRHLYQVVKYIDDQDDSIIDENSKYEYVKNVRAQLSNNEQILLYFNSLTKFGAPWIKLHSEDILSCYLIKYKMIKNIPLPNVNFSVRPEIKFEREIEELHRRKPSEELFEWHEMVKRN